MKRIRRICLGSTAFLASVILLTGCTNDAVIDEYGYRESAYPQISASSADVFPIPLDQQVKYADLVIEGEVISVNPSEPAVYTYREGDMGVGFMKWENILQKGYELFTYEVKVTAIFKGTSRILMDWLNCPDLRYLVPVVKVAIPPFSRGMYEEGYTNVKAGDKMLLLLMDYANGMYTPTSPKNSLYTIRDGRAYVSNFIPEWYTVQGESHVRLTDRPDMTDCGSYKELINQLKEYLNGGMKEYEKR